MRLNPRILIVIAGLVAMLILAAPPAAAHPPSGLELSYDDVAGELRATFTHFVEDPATHYVESVRIEGPATLLDYNYTSQPTAGTFTYTYPLRLDPRTTITVRGNCSIGGEVVQSLAIGAGTTNTTAAGTTAVPTTAQIPGFTLLAACVALMVGGVLLAKR